jgi:predicted membrane chloride channel (bestrophin family)
MIVDSFSIVYSKIKWLTGMLSQWLSLVIKVVSGSVIRKEFRPAHVAFLWSVVVMLSRNHNIQLFVAMDYSCYGYEGVWNCLWEHGTV